MDVYVFVGKSGTGKSYQAINLCIDKGIEAIIDDGLFINKGEVKAGKSAKRDKTIIGAVKTAIFKDEEHRKEVINKIKKSNIKSILVLGTSDGMVKKIVDALDLGEIKEYIYIEDITTRAERELARKKRNVQGKHVVPVPTMELKKHFSGYFLQPLSLFHGKDYMKEIKNIKTEVRPTYSYLGEFSIDEKIFKDIIKCLATEIEGIQNIIKVVSKESINGMDVTILISLNMEKGIYETLTKMQKQAYYIITEMTSYHISSLNIEVRSNRG